MASFFVTDMAVRFLAAYSVIMHFKRVFSRFRTNLILQT